MVVATRPGRLWPSGRDTWSEDLGKAVVAYLPLVKYTVGRLMGSLKLDGVMDHEDLLSFGTLGLIQALHTYDAERKTKFSSLAMLRIKGAIIDAVRALDPLPRSVRLRVREVARAVEQLQARLGRAPTNREIARTLGISVEDLSITMQAAERSSLPLQELASRWDEDAGGYFYSDVPDEDRLSDPAASAERNFEHALVRGAVAQLDGRERQVVRLHYGGGLTLKQISERLALSQSRVSQIHTQALRKLRSELRAAMSEAA